MVSVLFRYLFGLRQLQLISSRQCRLSPCRLLTITFRHPSKPGREARHGFYSHSERPTCTTPRSHSLMFHLPCSRLHRLIPRKVFFRTDDVRGDGRDDMLSVDKFHNETESELRRRTNSSNCLIRQLSAVSGRWVSRELKMIQCIPLGWTDTKTCIILILCLSIRYQGLRSIQNETCRRWPSIYTSTRV